MAISKTYRPIFCSYKPCSCLLGGDVGYMFWKLGPDLFFIASPKRPLLSKYTLITQAEMLDIASKSAARRFAKELAH